LQPRLVLPNAVVVTWEVAAVFTAAAVSMEAVALPAVTTVVDTARTTVVGLTAAIVVLGCTAIMAADR